VNHLPLLLCRCQLDSAQERGRRGKVNHQDGDMDSFCHERLKSSGQENHFRMQLSGAWQTAKHYSSLRPKSCEVSYHIMPWLQ
jgi:hypothetical protein